MAQVAAASHSDGLGLHISSGRVGPHCASSTAGERPGRELLVAHGFDLGSQHGHVACPREVLARVLVADRRKDLLEHPHQPGQALSRRFGEWALEDTGYLTGSVRVEHDHVLVFNDQSTEPPRERHGPVHVVHLRERVELLLNHAEILPGPPVSAYT